MSWFMLKPFFLQVFPSDIDFAEPNTEEAAADISPQVYLDFPFFFKNSLVLSEYCVCKNLKCVFSRLWMTCTTRCEALWRTETKYFARSWELTPSLTFWQSAVMKQSLIIGQKPMWWVFSNWNTFCLSCPVKRGVGGISSLQRLYYMLSASDDQWYFTTQLWPNVRTYAKAKLPFKEYFVPSFPLVLTFNIGIHFSFIPSLL